MGKSLLIGILLSATLLPAAGLRYKQVCEVENGPRVAGVEGFLAEIEAEVLISQKARLVRGAKHSLLYRIGGNGEAEVVEINHAGKFWRVFTPEAADKKMGESKERIRGIQTKVTRRESLPDREIEGYATKGSGLEIGFDLSEIIRDRALGKDGREIGERVLTGMQGTRYSVETWVTQEIKSPLEHAKANRGVDVRSARLNVILMQALGMAEGGAEAMAQVNEMGDGFAMETVLRMEHPMLASQTPDPSKPLLIRVSAKNLEKVEIDEKEFAIPEGYRRIE